MRRELHNHYLTPLGQSCNSAVLWCGFCAHINVSTHTGPAAMKVKSSLKSLKNRHRDCRVVRRKGRLYVINKTQRRFKARQG